MFVSKCALAIICCGAVLEVSIGMPLPHQKGNKRTGAVVTNGAECAEIGWSVLEKNGSAIDALIASSFCEGLALPQNMGLGGGFLVTIYEKANGIVRILNAREVAPMASTVNMFNGSSDLSEKGGLATAVPGELKGYWYLHQRYGILPWKQLVQPSIDLCRNGIYVTAYSEKLWRGKKDELYKDPVLREIFIDPDTNSTYVEGQYIYRRRLAETLKAVANEGVDALYSANGSLTRKLVEDIQAKGGIITIADMESYKPIWQEPIKTNFEDGTRLYSAPLPGSGAVLTLILNILENFLDSPNFYNAQTYQKIIESFKWAYGKRTEMGDDNFVDIRDLLNNLTSKAYAKEIRKKIFKDHTSQNASYYGAKTVVPEDHGTANIVVLAPNGDAVVFTSTINLVISIKWYKIQKNAGGYKVEQNLDNITKTPIYQKMRLAYHKHFLGFGAGYASNSTGIILNDSMDDFSSPNITNSFGLPPSPNNFIEPGKRPLSSMTPTILVKGEKVLLAIGAAGGTKITTIVATVIIKHLWYNIGIKRAIDEKRAHHQLFPMKIEYEEGFETMYPEIAKNLTNIGHDSMYTNNGFAALTAITTKDGGIEGAYDVRRGGYIAYI